ncbi:hypothetical protein [Rubrivivax gelatinosus]|uniref:hypothetical protein n=1 Tax=Rubrivivax gelatinosus TaxID=28068 RepID=UPI0006831CDF|nr:hypothetical protein [Rubrivivax gelatinosus]MBG6083230.1 hypothetical protein [Rubrivivax gelatinosus]
MAELKRPTKPKEQMPGFAAFMDELRAQLGHEWVVRIQKEGLQNGSFWAIENGYVIGRPSSSAIRDAAAAGACEPDSTLPAPRTSARE